jgi:casein kinase 1
MNPLSESNTEEILPPLSNNTNNNNIASVVETNSSSDSPPSNKLTLTDPVNKKYRLGRLIGSGAFGDVYVGTDLATDEEVAIKLERIYTRCPQLLFESKLYQIYEGNPGISSLRWFGRDLHYNILVTDLLGPSMEDLFNTCNRKFSFLTVMMVAEQMLTRIELFHSIHFIHCDIKPDNFLIGRGNFANIIYIIDFGLAKRFEHPVSKKHISYVEGKQLTGTPRFASLRNHAGIELSRRDDLESLGFVLVYFAKGRLPWEGMPATNRQQKYQKIVNSCFTHLL